METVCHWRGRSRCRLPACALGDELAKENRSAFPDPDPATISAAVANSSDCLILAIAYANRTYSDTRSQAITKPNRIEQESARAAEQSRLAGLDRRLRPQLHREQRDERRRSRDVVLCPERRPF